MRYITATTALTASLFIPAATPATTTPSTGMNRCEQAFSSVTSDYTTTVQDGREVTIAHLNDVIGYCISDGPQILDMGEAASLSR